MHKNKLWKLLIILAAMILLCTCMKVITVKADFGNFAGDSDFGGGGGSWDSGSSWDSDFDLAMKVIEVIITVIFVIIIIIYFIISMIKGDKNEGTKSTASSGIQLSPLSEYVSLDPGFNEAEFREHLSNLYIQMQQRWHERDISSLKPYFTDAFYYQSEVQLNEMIRNRQTPCTERVAVLEVTPQGFYRNADMDHMVVTIRSRIVAYVVDDQTGTLVSGDRNREKFMTYEWDLCRRSGTVTGLSDGLRTVTCPHCGAPVSINQTAKCSYCGSTVTIENNEWALNNIKGIAQQTI